MFLFPPLHILKFLVKSQPQRSYKKRFLFKKECICLVSSDIKQVALAQASNDEHETRSHDLIWHQVTPCKLNISLKTGFWPTGSSLKA